MSVVALLQKRVKKTNDNKKEGRFIKEVSIDE